MKCFVYSREEFTFIFFVAIMVTYVATQESAATAYLLTVLYSALGALWFDARRGAAEEAKARTGGGRSKGSR
jgi:hypothetical protein